VLPHLSGVHAVVTDPPAGISFMGKTWDTDHGGRDNWIAAFGRIASLVKSAMLPGAHALVWSIPRTSHWTATAWEDGGFEVRDRIAHCFGSGFPKSLDVSKAIDKVAGAEREVVGRRQDGRYAYDFADNSGHVVNTRDVDKSVRRSDIADLTAPATEAARQWSGWGTALKPAIEDWWLLRVPLIGTVAENVLAHGTGGINVDGCRVGTTDTYSYPNGPGGTSHQYSSDKRSDEVRPNPAASHALGRWPAHLIHDGSEDVVGLFPVTTSGTFPAVQNSLGTGNALRPWQGKVGPARDMGDSGSAARFFYCAKASKQDRDEGCEGMGERTTCYMAKANGTGEPSMLTDDQGRERDRFTATKRNHHPTVKPTALMAYLCRLVTPPGGIILDPFMGSGSTGKAAIREGFRFIGIERDPDYAKIAVARMERELAQPCLPTLEPTKATQEVLL
jgi:site-specific DNA-methyltransferase (adenine-specific)